MENRSIFTGGEKTPEMKLTKPVISTKECCQEHAGEIFNIKLAIRFKEIL